MTRRGHITLCRHQSLRPVMCLTLLAELPCNPDLNPQASGSLLGVKGDGYGSH